MNIVKAEPYTTHTCAMRRLQDQIEWAVRDRKPKSHIAGLMRDFNSHWIKFNVFIVKDYEERQ